MNKAVILLLTIIAVNLCAITVKLYAFSIPSRGDFYALQHAQSPIDLIERAEQIKKLNDSIPIIHIEGGTVTANVQ
jgi:DNA phosphorothioation-dependent restriction protein DptG